MHITALIAAAMLGAAVCGWQLGKTKWPGTLSSVLLCLLLVAGAYLSHHPALIPEAAIGALAVYLQTSWYAPLATALFYLAASHSFERLPEKKRGLGAWTRMQAILGLLCTAILFAAAKPTLFSPQEILAEIQAAQELGIAPPADSILVRQSLNYTCGPSACATLLRAAGIDPQASEAELAVLCITRPHEGSSVLGLAAGLKAKVASRGWHVQIVAAEWDAFLTLHKPVVCSMTFNGSPHVIVALQSDPVKGVRVADPVGFQGWLMPDEFKREYNGEVVAVYRESSTEPPH